MFSRNCDWWAKARLRPGRLAAAALALAATGYLLWLGGEAWQFHQAKSAAQEALARYDFAEARRRLDRCLQLRPGAAPLHLLAAQAARRAGDLQAAQQHLDLHRELAGAA